jgi:hypothetical protein
MTIEQPSQTNTSLLCAICPHSYVPEKTSRSVTHPNIALGQARLTKRFFRYMLPKNKIHLIGMSTLLSLGLGYNHPPGPGYHIQTCFKPLQWFMLYLRWSLCLVSVCVPCNQYKCISYDEWETTNQSGVVSYEVDGVAPNHSCHRPFLLLSPLCRHQSKHPKVLNNLRGWWWRGPPRMAQRGLSWPVVHRTRPDLDQSSCHMWPLSVAWQVKHDPLSIEPMPTRFVVH